MHMHFLLQKRKAAPLWGDELELRDDVGYYYYFLF